VTPAHDVARRRRVLLTRSAEDCAEWAERLGALGATPVALPCIHAETIDTPPVRATVAAAVADADWLVFTSRRGVEAFVALGGSAPARTKIAVVGAGTAAVAQELLGRVDLVGRGGTAASLADSLAANGVLAQRSHAVLPLAENAGDALERALSGAGARCTRLDVYRTVPAPPATPRRAMSSLGADNVILASPTAVTGFVQQVIVDVPV
jgi:uroporphyrinogen-III synthase